MANTQVSHWLIESPKYKHCVSMNQLIIKDYNAFIWFLSYWLVPHFDITMVRFFVSFSLSFSWCSCTGRQVLKHKKKITLRFTPIHFKIPFIDSRMQGQLTDSRSWWVCLLSPGPLRGRDTPHTGSCPPGALGQRLCFTNTGCFTDNKCCNAFTGVGSTTESQLWLHCLL